MKNKRNKNKNGSGRRSDSAFSQSSSQGSDALHEGKNLTKLRKRIPKGQSPGETKKVRAPKLRCRTAMGFSKSTVSSRNKLVKRSASALSDKLIKVRKLSPKKWRAARSRDGKQKLPKSGETNPRASKDRYVVKSRRFRSPKKLIHSTKREIRCNVSPKHETCRSLCRAHTSGAHCALEKNPVVFEGESSAVKKVGHSSSSPLPPSETDSSSSTEDAHKVLKMRAHSQVRSSCGTPGRVKPKRPLSSSELRLQRHRDKEGNTGTGQGEGQTKIKETRFISGKARVGDNVNTRRRYLSPRGNLNRPLVLPEQSGQPLEARGTEDLCKNMAAQNSASKVVQDASKRAFSEYSTTSDETVAAKTEQHRLQAACSVHVIPCCHCCCSSAEDVRRDSRWKGKAVHHSSNVSFKHTEKSENHDDKLKGNYHPPSKTNESSDAGQAEGCKEIKKPDENKISSPCRCCQKENLACDSSPVRGGDASGNQGAVGKAGRGDSPARENQNREGLLLLSKSLSDHLQTVVEYQALLSDNMRSLLAELDRIGQRAAKPSINSAPLPFSASGRRLVCPQTGRLKFERFSEEEKLGKVQKIIEEFEKRREAWPHGTCTNRSQHTQTVGSSSADSSPEETDTGNFSDRTPSSRSCSDVSERKDEKSPSLDFVWPGCQPEQPWFAFRELQSISVQTENIRSVASYLRDWRYNCVSSDNCSNKSFSLTDESTRSLLTGLLKEMDMWKQKLSIQGVHTNNAMRELGGDAPLAAIAPRPSLSTSLDDLITLPYSNRNCSSCVHESPEVWGHRQHRLRPLAYPARMHRDSANSYCRANTVEEHTKPLDLGTSQGDGAAIQPSGGMNTARGSHQLQSETPLSRESWRVFYWQSALLVITILLQFGIQVAIQHFRD